MERSKISGQKVAEYLFRAASLSPVRLKINPSSSVHWVGSSGETASPLHTHRYSYDVRQMVERAGKRYHKVSVAVKSCPTLCNPMDCSTTGSSVLHYLPTLFKFMSIESVMLSNHLILCCPHLLLPSVFSASGSFTMSQIFPEGSQIIGLSASVLPMNIQEWDIPLGLTGLIFLMSKGLSRVFSSTTVQKHQFFWAQPSLCSNSHIHKWLLEKPEFWLYGPSKVIYPLFNMLSKLAIAFLPRSKCLLVSWLQLQSTVILEPKKIKSVTASTFSPSICHEVMGLHDPRNPWS